MILTGRYIKGSCGCSSPRFNGHWAIFSSSQLEIGLSVPRSKVRCPWTSHTLQQTSEKGRLSGYGPFLLKKCAGLISAVFKMDCEGTSFWTSNWAGFIILQVAGSRSTSIPIDWGLKPSQILTGFSPTLSEASLLSMVPSASQPTAKKIERHVQLYILIVKSTCLLFGRSKRHVHVYIQCTYV